MVLLRIFKAGCIVRGGNCFCLESVVIGGGGGGGDEDCGFVVGNKSGCFLSSVL